MGRWKPNARGRLEQAALELYGERGFEQTTVKDIAERAGLTERTFFRHFADKREVLFPAHALQDSLTSVLADIPADTTPLDAVAVTFETAAGQFEERKELVRRRQAVIAAHAELQERELTKLAAISSALTGALRGRGVPEPAASLAAEGGLAVFKVAYGQWLDDPEERDFAQHLREGFRGLEALVDDRRSAPRVP